MKFALFAALLIAPFLGQTMNAMSQEILGSQEKPSYEAWYQSVHGQSGHEHKREVEKKEQEARYAKQKKDPFVEYHRTVPAA